MHVSEKGRSGKRFIGFYVEPHVKEKLEAVATLTGTSVSTIMRGLAEDADLLVKLLPRDWNSRRPYARRHD